MKVALRVEGEYGRGIITVERVNHGWERLADMVEEYLTKLKADPGLAWEHDKWDLFHDELAARALKPWDDFGLIEAPSGRLWGVESL